MNKNNNDIGAAVELKDTLVNGPQVLIKIPPLDYLSSRQLIGSMF